MKSKLGQRNSRNRAVNCYFIFCAVNRRFKPSKLTFLSALTLIISATYTGCGEITQLVKNRFSDAPAGLNPRDYRSTYLPLELLLESSKGSFGLTQDLKAAGNRMTGIGEDQAASQLLGFDEAVAAFAKARVLGTSVNETSAALAALPSLPSVQTIAADLQTFAAETPNLKTDIVTLLDDRRQAPLTEKKRFPARPRTMDDLKNGAFRVLLVPQPIFKGLATAFDENSTPAEDVGVPVAHEDATTEWTLTEASSTLIWGRSLQPSNEFQALMECAKVTIQLKQDGSTLTQIWPRYLAQERSDAMLTKPSADGLRKVNRGSSAPSELRVELRPSAILATKTGTGGSSSESPSESTARALTSAPAEFEGIIIRAPEGISIHLERHSYDGAQTAQAYTLFHESQRFFVFRLNATLVETTKVSNLVTSFQLPYSLSLMTSQSNRNEFGLWRHGFSGAQQDYLRSSISYSGTNAPPQDRWTRLDRIRIYDPANSKLTPTESPEMKPGGLHRIDPAQLANEPDQLLLIPKIRNNASDSEIVTPEKYLELEAICRRAF